MIILGIDTSTNYGSVALIENGRLLSESYLPLNYSYSNNLINVIDNLLGRNKTEIADVDGYAVSIGPGSFTGLRIGLATCKGFHIATGKPIMPVGTLDAMVESLLSDSMFFKSKLQTPNSGLMLCPIIDAKKGEVYASLYEYDKGTIKKITDDIAISPEMLCQKINKPTIFFGDGLKLYNNIIKDKLKGFAYFYGGMIRNSIATTIALKGMEKLERGDVTDSAILKPRYIRRSEAEIKYGSHWSMVL